MKRFVLLLSLALASCQETGTIQPAEATPQAGWLRKEREASISWRSFTVYCDTVSGNLIYVMTSSSGEYFQVVPGACEEPVG